MAKQAVASLAILTLLSKEAPIDRDPPWITHNGLYHAPDEKDEEQMEDDKQDDVGCGLDGEHILKDKDIVVEKDETDDSDEMRIEQSATTHFLNDY